MSVPRKFYVYEGVCEYVLTAGALEQRALRVSTVSLSFGHCGSHRFEGKGKKKQ